MKIAILTVNHAYANFVVRELLWEYNNEIVFVGYSKKLLPNKSFLQALLRYYNVSGLKYIILQAVKLEIYKNLNTVLPKFYSSEKLANALKITARQVDNINDPITIKKLSKMKPDIIVSVFFNQILKSEIISIPPKGVINIHPSYLPNYKGVSPVFWAIANKEKNAGVSVHFIDQGIDTGGIIARKKIMVDEKDTEDSLYWKCVYLGLPLLKKTIDSLNKGKVKTISNRGKMYFSLPSKDAVKSYSIDQRPFFRLKDYLFEEGYHFWTLYPRIYDLIQFLATGGFMQKIIKELGFLQGKTVLDIGCGTGNLAAHFKWKSYTGIDINSHYISLAKQKYPKLKFKTLDIISQDLPEVTYDYAIAINIMHHLSDEQLKVLFKKIKQAKIRKFIIVESHPWGALGNFLERLDAGAHFRSFDSLKKTLSKYLKIKSEKIVSAPLGTYKYIIIQCG